MAKFKVKTKRGAAKRFKVKSSGKIKCKHAYLKHNMRKRNANNKRGLRHKTHLSKSDEKSVMALLPNSF